MGIEPHQVQGIFIIALGRRSEEMDIDVGMLLTEIESQAGEFFFQLLFDPIVTPQKAHLGILFPVRTGMNADGEGPLFFSQTVYFP